MKIIVGLGNPEEKYAQTRHNAGFLAIDFYLKDKEAISCQSKFNGQICEMHSYATPLGTEAAGANSQPRTIGKLFFVKPQSYMNNSGEVVREICEFYKIKPNADLLVIHDEKDLPFGTIRATKSSSSAGHNGVQNIIDKLGTQDFNRIRIGVESRTDKVIPTDVFVLQNFSPDEFRELEKSVFPKVIEGIESFIHQ